MSLGSGLGLRPRVGGGVAAFNPLSLLWTAFYDVSDLATVWQDSARTTPASVNGVVGALDDKSGNGYHLTQATTASKGILRQSGALYHIEFDGIDDWIRATFTIAQPWDRISAIKLEALVAATRVFGGVTGDNGLLYQANATELSVYDGTGIVAHRTVTAATDYVITERHDNANSRLALDNGTYGTGTSGTGLPGGVTVAAGNGGVSNTQIDLFAMGMINRALTDPEIASTRTWMAAKQGRVL